MERRPEISGLDEQNLPGAVAINEHPNPDDTFIEAMRAKDKALMEDGSNPSTHPLNRGGWKAPEPTSGIGEGTNPTG